MKIITVIGTRPEIIRLSRVMSRLDQHLDHIIVHTGQNYDYELNQIFFDELDIRKPDYFLKSAKPGNTPSQTVGVVIARMDEVLAEVAPDALLCLVGVGRHQLLLVCLPGQAPKDPDLPYGSR
jgi:UDP-N-acetylglucosamine 2-epimerase (non-hydrolysing)